MEYCCRAIQLSLVSRREVSHCHRQVMAEWMSLAPAWEWVLLSHLSLGWLLPVCFVPVPVANVPVSGKLIRRINQWGVRKVFSGRATVVVLHFLCISAIHFSTLRDRVTSLRLLVRESVLCRTICLSASEQSRGLMYWKVLPGRGKSLVRVPGYLLVSAWGQGVISFAPALFRQGRKGIRWTLLLFSVTDDSTSDGTHRFERTEARSWRCPAEYILHK